MSILFQVNNYSNYQLIKSGHYYIIVFEQVNRTPSDRSHVHFSKICDGIPHCRISQNDEKNCSQRFYCKSKNKASISIDKKCDGIIDCDDGSDETETACPNRFFCTVDDKQVNNDGISN